MVVGAAELVRSRNRRAPLASNTVNACWGIAFISCALWAAVLPAAPAKLWSFAAWRCRREIGPHGRGPHWHRAARTIARGFGFSPVAPGTEVQPFANQNGGVDVDEKPPPRLYSHGPCASPLAREMCVDCSAWNSSPEGGRERADMVEKVLAVLKMYGFAIVEGIVPPEEQLAMEAEAIRHFDNMPPGFQTSPLRADRCQVHVPYTWPWSAEWLAHNDLVLQVTARYCTNNMACGRTEDEQQEAWCQWVMQGSDIDWFRAIGPQKGHLAESPPEGCTNVGSSETTGPWLGRVMITKTPAKSPLMTRHRDIILPGPCAQLTIGVPLTPLVANNGPLGLRPRSHVMHTPGYEVVTNIPPGAIMLYDSFVDHRAMENHLPRDRYVLYYEFETRGIFTGYVQGHFGREAAKSEHDFRRAVDPVLRQYVEQVQAAR